MGNAMSTKDNLEVAVDLSDPNAAEEEDENKNDIFVCLEECYIYSIPGDDKGNPKDDADIVYDTVEDELLQLDVDRRNSNYVRCLLPKEGWVFLPDESAQYNWGPLDAIINQKRREKEAQEEEE